LPNVILPGVGTTPLETDNEPKSKIEVKVREKADRDGLKAKGMTMV
jgi:hypothetical protein